MTDNLGVQAADMVDEKIREYRTLQEELNTHRSDMGMLMAQRNENELVKQELDTCDQEASDGSDFVIYKQIGPILIKNDLEEAKDTISKRLEFITGEIKKVETMVTNKEEESDEVGRSIQEMQGAMQKAAVEAAKAAAIQAA